VTFFIAGCSIYGDSVHSQVQVQSNDNYWSVRLFWPLPRSLQANPSTHVWHQVELGFPTAANTWRRSHAGKYCGSCSHCIMCAFVEL